MRRQGTGRPEKPPRASPTRAEPPVGVAEGEEQTEGEDEPDEEEDEPPDERNPLAVRRDELIDPIVTSLARRLKRTLQDTQNELLDSLRSGGSPWSIQLLPDETEHVDSFATAALPALEQAASAGVSFAGPGATQGPKTDVLVGIAHDLAEAVVGPLRRSSRTTRPAWPMPTKRWWPNTSGPPSGNGRVNASSGWPATTWFRRSRPAPWRPSHLTPNWSGWPWPARGRPLSRLRGQRPQRAQQPGQEFPTGHLRPPAHPGCRCLLTRSAT